MKFLQFVSILFLLSVIAHAAPKEWPAKIRFGLIPFEGSGANVKERFAPMFDYLSQKLGVPVVYSTASDYAGIITAMEHGHIDFAYLGPKSYVEAAKKADARVLVKEVNINGYSGYHGLIITRSDSGINSIKDAQGRTFAFTGPNSTSGYLVPNIRFYRSKPPIIPSRFFKQIKFSGHHKSSILSVKNRSIDVAATNDVDLEKMIKRGIIKKGEMKILWKSDIIPGAVIAARRKLPSSMKMSFKKAMLNLPYKVKKILGNGGFTDVKDSEYDIIRYMISLKKKLSRKK